MLIRKKIPIKLQDIVHLLPGNVYWKDRGLKYAGCNIEQAQALGLNSPDELVGKTDYDFLLKDEASKIARNDKIAMKSEKSLRFEETVLLPTGKKSVYLSQKTPLFDDTGKLSGILGVSIDITDIIEKDERYKKRRLYAERKMRQTEMYLRNVISQIPGSVYWKNVKGVYLGCNDYFAKIAGVSSVRQIIGKSDNDLAWGKFARKSYEKDKDIMKAGIPNIYEEEIEIIADKKLTFLTNKVPLKDEKGNLAGILGVSIDISDRKKIEKKLNKAKALAERRSKETGSYLENIINRIPGSIYWKDKNGFYLGCNDYVARMAGLKSPNEVIGKTDYDFLWKKRADIIWKTDQGIMKSGQPRTLEETSEHADGTVVTLLSNKTPLRDSKGNIVGILGVSIDITKRKKAEDALMKAKKELEIANQAKSEFMANMSHDLKTPLHAIIGISDILKGQNLTKQQQIDFLDDLSHSAQTLAQLVETVLDFDHVYSGKFDINFEPIDLSNIIENIVDNMAHSTREKNLRIIIDYPTTVPRLLVSDKSCITRILLNLIDNAIKFTEKGYVIVSVEEVSRKKGNIILQIAVEDTGIGIPKDKLNVIFDRFHRLEPAYKGLKKGHGLGLAIVKELANKLDGKVSIHSTVNYGTTFIIELPFKLQSTNALVSHWQKKYPKARILIIDDHDLEGGIIAKQLPGDEVSVCKSNEALDELLKAANEGIPYRIAIIDDEIKKFTAVEMVTIINSINLLPKTLMLLFTKPATAAYFNKAKESGFFDYIIKPIRPTELLKKLSSAWEKWERE